MRRILFVPLIAVFAACGDDSHSTAPTAARSAANAPANASISTVGGTAQGKPADAVGFTKDSTYWSPAYTVDAGNFVDRTLTCPAGTVLTGGGYQLEPGSLDHPPFVRLNVPNGNGWRLFVLNLATGAENTHLVIYVRCAS
jgi:hypothetical protein